MARPRHLVSLHGQRRVDEVLIFKWVCSCGKTGRLWLDNPERAWQAGQHHIPKD